MSSLVSHSRGKLLHHDCSFPRERLQYLHVAVASLSQFIHSAESGLGPVVVPSLHDKASDPFEWDRQLGPPLPAPLARRAIYFGLTAIKYCAARGQPIWPAVPSSLFGAFLDELAVWGVPGRSNVLVMTFDASVYGWGAVFRTSPRDHGMVASGQLLSGGCCSHWASSRLSWRHKLSRTIQLSRCIVKPWPAILLSTQQANKHFALSRFSILIHNDCMRSSASQGQLSFPCVAGCCT